MSAEALDHRGMVMDFDEVKRRLQDWIDQTVDHKMLLNQQDPLIPTLESSKEPIVVLEQNPTAEVIAQRIFEFAKAQGFPVTEVRLWETPTSFATYRPS